MAAWDNIPIVEQAQAAPVQTSAPFAPMSGSRNALVPGRMKVLAVVPPKPRASATLTYREPTDEERVKYPGVAQMSSAGRAILGKANTGGNATDDDIDTLTDKYLATGDVPATGMGGLDFKTKIFHAAQERLNALGLTGADAAAEQQKYKANAASLSDTVKRRSTIAGFEGTAQDSLKLAEEWAKKALPNTGFAVTNQAENWYKSFTQDPAMKSLKDATKTVTAEYAKIMSGATNGSITSDQARARADEMLSEADSPQAYAAAVAILRQEMQFRINNLDNQVNNLTGELHKGIGSMAAVGDYRAFNKAWEAKNGSTDGAKEAWMNWRRTGDVRTPWRQAFPDLKLSGAPKGRRYNPETQSIEDVN